MSAQKDVLPRISLNEDLLFAYDNFNAYQLSSKEPSITSLRLPCSPHEVVSTLQSSTHAVASYGQIQRQYSYNHLVPGTQGDTWYVDTQGTLCRIYKGSSTTSTSSTSGSGSHAAAGLAVEAVHALRLPPAPSPPTEAYSVAEAPTGETSGDSACQDRILAVCNGIDTLEVIAIRWEDGKPAVRNLRTLPCSPAHIHALAYDHTTQDTHVLISAITTIHTVSPDSNASTARTTTSSPMTIQKAKQPLSKPVYSITLITFNTSSSNDDHCMYPLFSLAPAAYIGLEQREVPTSSSSSSSSNSGYRVVVCSPEPWFPSQEQAIATMTPDTASTAGLTTSGPASSTQNHAATAADANDNDNDDNDDDDDDDDGDALTPQELAAVAQRLAPYTSDNPDAVPWKEWHSRGPLHEVDDSDPHEKNRYVTLHAYGIADDKLVCKREQDTSMYALFTTYSHFIDGKHRLPSLLLHADVDLAILQEKSEDQGYQHSTSFPGLAYVVSGKQHAKLAAVSSQFSRVALVEHSHYLYIYDRPQPNAMSASQYVIELPRSSSDHSGLGQHETVWGLMFLDTSQVLVLTSSAAVLVSV